MPTRFDAHCHFLNVQYLFRELLAMTLDGMTGNYPYPKSMVPGGLMTEFAAKGPGPDFTDFIKSLVSLMMNLTDSPQKVYENMEAAFGACWDDCALATVPLMMDIYYAFDNGKVPPWKLKPSAGLKFAMPLDDGLKERFNQQADSMKEAVKGTIMETGSKNGVLLAYAGLDDILDSIIGEFNDEFLSGKTIVNKSIPGKTLLSWGYRKQLEEIEDMKKNSKDKGRIFPFLAVDPRRPGIMELVREKFGAGERLFSGIKLYPPLGYLPSYPVLYELYDFCCSKNIPITFHCADGPIHTYCHDMTVYSKSSEPYQKHFNSEAEINGFFTAIENWSKVFRDYPHLKINFAHFGGYNEMKKIKDPAQWPESWTKKIIDMMEQNPGWNIYADISAYPQADGSGFIDQIWADHPAVRNRLLFGSDYIIELFLWKPIGGYYRQFKDKLDAGLVDRSGMENARAFLNIE